MMETWTLVKEVLSVGFLCGLLLWLFVNAYLNWSKDIRRHKEVNAFIELFQVHNKELLLAYANVLTKLQDRQTLLLYRDERGRLQVKALSAKDEAGFKEELERQEKVKQ